jgi:hypothetical protein
MSKKFAAAMQQEFEMSMLGELSFFLGLQIHQSERGIFISQSKYLKEILKKFGMENCAPVSTPMTTSCKLNKDDDAPEIDQTMYMSMIGNLLYLIASRLDIIQAVGLVGIFQENPKETHVLAVKRIFRYLQGTVDYGLWYPKDTNLVLKAYTNADWEGSIDDRKSTSGDAFFLGSCLVSWLSKKQTSISLSTTEAEYIVTTSCCTQVLWIKNNLKDIQVPCEQPVSIMCDNTNAINLSKNLVQHSKTKHIPIKYHFLREQVQDQVVKLEYVPSKEKIVDIFTKPLPREPFEYLRHKLGVISSSFLQ